VRSVAKWRDPATLATVAVLVLGLVHAARWSFLCDDAYISFRYARNLADFGELAFNVAPLERVEGYTNFAWVVVLALGAELGVPPERGAIALGFVAYAALLLAAGGLARVLLGDRSAARFAPLVTVALLAASPESVVWATSGLETGAAAALVLTAMLAWEREHPRAAAVLAALAVLTRPDAVVPLGAWGIGWLVVELRGRGIAGARLRAWALASAWLLVPLVGHLLWRRAYYGTWLPNTWAVKAHGAALRDPWGIAYVQSWIAAMFLPWLAPLLLLVRARVVPLLLAIAATLVYAWSVGGDFMAYSRFLLPATAALAVVVGVCTGIACELVARRWPDRSALAHAPLALGLALACALAWHADRRFVADRDKPEGWLDGKWEGVTTMARFAEVGIAAGTWMRSELPPTTLITVGAAGAVPYASGLPTIDAFGLVDPVIARMPEPPLRDPRSARPGHQLFAPPEYIRSRDPDLLCHVGFRGNTPPRESDARPPFRTGYAWACVRPGPGSAREPGGGSFDPGVYCCRRPRDRVVGPFGSGAPGG
jgi:arabinofuranosyltransferase